MIQYVSLEVLRHFWYFAFNLKCNNVHSHFLCLNLILRISYAMKNH